MLFSFSVIYASSKSDLNLQYSKALQAYKAKNFGTSYEIFSKLYLSRLSDAKLNFYFGRSAYETGHYEVALAAFERVEMLDPGNLRNRLEMARIYYMLKMYEDAELAFKEVLANPNIPQNVRTNIELYLSRATKAQKKSFTYATVNLDFLYDSNVNYG
jgi:tetratricopeptide (TPR) repeat protein